MFEVTKFDKDMVAGITFSLDGSSTDLPIAGAITVPGKAAGVIPFQFPPRITSDSKDNKWKTVHAVFAWEPLKMWEGSNSRKITVSAVYVATGSAVNNVTWNPSNIAITTRALKQYFYSGSKPNVFPTVELVLYDHIPTGPKGNAKFRMMNVNIKPGKELITANGATFSLRTEVTFTLEQVTRITKGDGESKLKFTNFPEFPPQAWY